MTPFTDLIFINILLSKLHDSVGLCISVAGVLLRREADFLTKGDCGLDSWK